MGFPGRYTCLWPCKPMHLWIQIVWLLRKHILGQHSTAMWNRGPQPGESHWEPLFRAGITQMSLDLQHSLQLHWPTTLSTVSSVVWTSTPLTPHSNFPVSSTAPSSPCPETPMGFRLWEDSSWIYLSTKQADRTVLWLYHPPVPSMKPAVLKSEHRLIKHTIFRISYPNQWKDYTCSQNSLSAFCKIFHCGVVHQPIVSLGRTPHLVSSAFGDSFLQAHSAQLINQLKVSKILFKTCHFPVHRKTAVPNEDIFPTTVSLQFK